MVNSKNNLFSLMICIGLFLIGLTACGRDQVVTRVDGAETTQIPEVMPTSTPLPSLTFTPSPTQTPSATPIVILDPEPIEIRFNADDGTELLGYYFPGSENPAPLIVLVHWAEGDLSEWDQIALWLQNRGQLTRTPDYNNSWKSSDWFPENEIKGPLGVFVFTLRDCEGGCQSYQPVSWLGDIEAAMAVASGLQGVDPGKLLTAGASIGADGAIHGCSWMNQVGAGTCLGTFALSPASLLTISFNDTVAELHGTDPDIPIYCLIGLRDDASVETCLDAPGIILKDYGYIEDHGLELIQPGKDPDALSLLREFINLAIAGAGE